MDVTQESISDQYRLRVEQLPISKIEGTDDVDEFKACVIIRVELIDVPQQLIRYTLDPTTHGDSLNWLLRGRWQHTRTPRTRCQATPSSS